MAPAPTLRALIAIVEADAAGVDALGQLAAAATTVADLEDVSDALLGHFVDACRRDGRSWSEISGALGVTRQAAHKRFSTATPHLDRFTPRANAVLASAAGEANGLGHNYVGTEHILLGLFGPAEGVAARVLAQMGVTRDRVEAQVLETIPRGSATMPMPPPYTPRVRRCLEHAVAEALAMGHNYVGTEHMLLSLFADDTSVAAKVLRELDVERDRCRDLIVAMLAGISATRT